MLRHLWKDRSRSPWLSRQFLRSWAKRLLTLPELLAIVWNQWCLRRKHASLAVSACVGNARFSGPLHRLRVGAETFIGRAEISLHAKVEIGSFVCINDGVVVHTGSHDLRDTAWMQTTAPVSIRDHAWIASGATILPGVTIGKGGVVGAGAVVARDVPDYALAVGNPAVIKHDRRVTQLGYSPVRFLAFQDAWLG